MPTRKTMVIMNPVADHGETLNKIGEIEDFLKTRIIADFHQTSYPKEAVQVARHLQDYDMVIVAGGDGTVHDCQQSGDRLRCKSRAYGEQP